MKVLTIAYVRRVFSPLGISLRKWDDEYRVNFVGGNEDTAYYTKDLQDALNTGVVMAKA